MASSHNGNRVRNFQNSYLDGRGAFRTAVESYCCVMGRTQLTAKRNGYFTFQTIINKTGAHDAISSF